MKLKDRVAIVTGGGSGIGQGICLELAKEGAKIVVVDVSEDGLKETADLLKELDNDCLTIQVDLTKTEELDKIVEKTVEKYGKIDILCNNAGIFDKSCKLLETDEKLYDLVMAINLKAPVMLSKKVIPVMQSMGNKKGVIVNTASINGLIPKGGGISYVISKHGVIGFTKRLAEEYGAHGIRVNAICPGPVESKMTAHMNPIAETFSKKRAKPAELGKLVAYLASDDAAFICGTAVVIDDGYSLHDRD